MLGAAAHTVAGNLVIAIYAGIGAVLFGHWFVRLWPRRRYMFGVWLIGLVALLAGLLSIQSAYYGAARVLLAYDIANLWNLVAATAGMRWSFIASSIGLIAIYLFLTMRRRRAVFWTLWATTSAAIVYAIAVQVLH